MPSLMQRGVLVAKAGGGYPQIVTIEESRPTPDSNEKVGAPFADLQRNVADDSVSRALQFVHPFGMMELTA